MSTRDAIETAIRAWDRHETDRGAPAVIDFDFHPPEEGAPSPAPADRLTTLRRLCELLDETDEPALSQRVRADVAYLRALMVNASRSTPMSVRRRVAQPTAGPTPTSVRRARSRAKR